MANLDIGQPPDSQDLRFSDMEVEFADTRDSELVGASGAVPVVRAAAVSVLSPTPKSFTAWNCIAYSNFFLNIPSAFFYLNVEQVICPALESVQRVLHPLGRHLDSVPAAVLAVVVEPVGEQRGPAVGGGGRPGEGDGGRGGGRNGEGGRGGGHAVVAAKAHVQRVGDAVAAKVVADVAGVVAGVARLQGGDAKHLAVGLEVEAVRLGQRCTTANVGKLSKFATTAISIFFPYSYVHSLEGLGSPTATHSRTTSSRTAAMTAREKEARVAGTGDCGVSDTISDSGPSPERVLARTQKLYG